MKASRLLIVSSSVALMAAAGCKDAAGPAAATLTGQWSGSISSSIVPAATIVLGLTQTGSTVVGRYHVPESGAWGNFAGTVAGSSVSFTLAQTAPASCTGTFAGTATVSGASLTLSYAGSDCLGSHANGTGSLSRTSSEPGSPLAGVWTGTTSQSLPVYFRVGFGGAIDSLTVRLRLSLATGTCTATFPAVPPIALTSAGSFQADVAIPAITNVTSTVQGQLTGAAASGTYSGFSGSFSLLCGSSFIIGTGSLLSSGTWSASRQ